MPESDSQPDTIKWPGCEKRCAADDLWAQKAHMEANHPEIIQARLDNNTY